MSPLIRLFLSALLGIVFSIEVSGAPIIIGPYTFSGEEAFPTGTNYISGDSTYIDHPDTGTWGMFSGNTTTDLDAVLTGYDVTMGIGGTGIIVDLTFGMASVINGPGADLVVFETFAIENFEIAALVGNTLTNRSPYKSAPTGLTIGDVTGNSNTSALNAVEIDLSNIGLVDGEAISGLRVYSQPFGIDPEDPTAGADIVVVGALNHNPVGIPEPSTFALIVFGIAGIGFSMRKASIFQ